MSGFDNVENVDETGIVAGADEMDVHTAEVFVLGYEVDDGLPVYVQGVFGEAGIWGELCAIDSESVEFEFQEVSSPSQWTFGVRGPAVRWRRRSAVQRSQSRVSARAR